MSFAKFELIKRLGAGHFGEVWYALDKNLITHRALKLINLSKLPDKGNFFREAQVLKLAEHENIVKVEETGIFDSNQIYVAMEYLEKGSLEDEASGGYVYLSRARRIMVDMLRGLEHAHSKGIIHRDIKPANIIIGNSNQGKLSDFGLAIAPSAGVPSGPKEYMYVAHLAPELISYNAPNVASDIYAAGVTFYRLINGDSYLPSVMPHDLLNKISKGLYPDRKRYREFIPRQIRIVCNKAMNIDRSKRYKTAEEMRRALEGLSIYMNWNEQTLAGKMRWSGSWDGSVFEVERGKDKKGFWFVQVRKGQSKHDLRRINDFCCEKLNLGEAIKRTEKTLQNIVTGEVS